VAAMSNFLENALVDSLFRGVAYTPPATLYVGLFTATPSDTGGGTEVATGSYARVALAATIANWAATNANGSTAASSTGTGGTTSNNVAITFPAPTANWGTIAAFGIFDAATAGNLLWWGALTVSKTVNNGDAAPSFQPSSLSIQIDN
jgi:hypothetical protein